MSPDIVQLCLPRAKDMWLALVVAVTLSLGSEYTHWLSEELYSIPCTFSPKHDDVTRVSCDLGQSVSLMFHQGVMTKASQMN